jgi:hypothetical protein
MKTTEFLIENTVIAQEGPDDISMVVNNLHTIMRVTADLASRVKGSEDLDEWIKEKIAVAKSMMVTVEDYIASQQEMSGSSDEMTTFDANTAERQFAESLSEDATGGASCSSTIAVTPQTLGEKGSFSRKEVNKKIGNYTNVLTRGGPVKVGK